MLGAKIVHHIEVSILSLTFVSDLFVCVEVDSYGHYFRKAKTKLVCNSATPHWNEEFIIELEGSQNLRILLYEESQDRAILRAKYTQTVRYYSILISVLFSSLNHYKRF